MPSSCTGISRAWGRWTRRPERAAKAVIVDIYFVRHGQTDYNRDDRCQGWVDIPLNATGLAQARALSNCFAEADITAIYSSPLSRTLATAEAIAEPHSLTIETDERLKELNQGELDGLTPGELAERYPEILEQWFRRPSHVELPGGESLLTVADRMGEALMDVRAAHGKGDTVVLVGHKLALLMLFCRLMGTPLDKFRRFHLDPGAFWAVSFGGREPELIHYNERPPLPARRLASVEGGGNW